MALTCNIDARGKAVRLVSGIALLVGGSVTTLSWALPAGGALSWAVSLGLLASGAFGIFEARNGWCALRALGVRTPL